MADRLAAQQIQQYQDQGYILFNQPVLPEASFVKLKAHFEQKLAQWTAEGLSPEHMDVPHFADPALFEWLFADEVLDLVEPLIGQDIALWSSHFISKSAGDGKRVPWHEDSAYWGQVLDPMDVVTIWLAIDPATSENGCMQVIPQTHQNGYSNYVPVENPDKEVFGTEIEQSSYDESKAINCILAPNECSMHHAKLIHGSQPNTSSIRRCGYTMRYVSAASRFRPDEMGNMPEFQIYLARGKDKAGNAYGDPTKINQAWLDRHAG